MRFTYLLKDVIRENVRSRMVYSYLVLSAIVIGLILNTVVMKIDRSNTDKFEKLVEQSMSGATVRARLTTLAQQPLDLKTNLAIWPNPQNYESPDANRIRLLETDSGIDLCVVETPEARLGAAVVYARGGILDETAEQYGLTNYAVKLLNGSIADCPEAYPLIAAPAGYNEDGLWLSVEFTPDYGFPALHSLIGLLTNSPIDPTSRAHRVLGSIINTIQQRKTDPETRGIETTLEKLIPEHRFSKTYLGERRRLVTTTKTELEAWLVKQFNPERIGLLIIGPYRVEQLMQWLEPSLQSIAQRERYPFPVNMSAVPACAGVNHRTCGTQERVTVAGGIRIEYASDTTSDYRMFELVRTLHGRWVMQLRDQGLVYGGYVKGPILAGSADVFVSVFTSAAEKELRLVSEIEAWLNQFPYGLEDAVLISCKNAIIRETKARRTQINSLATHILTRYLLRSKIPLTYSEELERWQHATAEELRRILAPEGSTKSVVITSVRSRSTL